MNIPVSVSVFGLSGDIYLAEIEVTMISQLTIETARLKDLEDIVSIYNSTVGSRMVTADTDPVTVQSRIGWFLEHNEISRPLWIVKETDEIIGWISFQSFYGRPAYQATAEISIYLDESHRGKGIGKELLDYSLKHCRELKITTLLGFIFSHNEPSQRLFRSRGFSEWAHLPEIGEIENKKMSLKILGKKIEW